METLPFNSTVALSGDCDSVLSLLELRGIRVISWASNIVALITGAGAESRWKTREAQRLRIRCIPVAELLATPVAAAEQELWTTKYAPKRITDVIGHISQINDLIAWLKGWTAAAKTERAALVSGPPGIGKTTVVHMIAHGCGYEIVEFNASNERSQSAVRKLFETAIGTASIGKRRLIVMDEVDGMSSGDRGGIGELARTIKTCVFPIICIANDRGSPKIRPLTSVCLDVRFSRPQKTTIAKALMATVVAKEKLAMKAADLETLCERNGNDIRSILNFLQFTSTAPAAKGAAAGAGTKDELQRVDAFSATGRLFGDSGAPLAEREALVFVDHGLVPLMVGEAYIAAAGRGRGEDGAKLERIVCAADSIGFGDILDRRIHSTQNWGLLPAAVQCTVAAAAAAAGPAPFQIFPSWLGKNSKRLKHRRWFADMGARTHTTQEAMADTVDLYRTRLFRSGKGAPEICDALQEMHLTRDDMLETLVETCFTGNESAVAIDTKTKSAISREWKKRCESGAVVESAAAAADDCEADTDEEEILEY